MSRRSDPLEGIEPVLYHGNMKVIPDTAAREQLSSTMEEVIANDAPVTITRNDNGAVVMLSLADCESMEETAYLMSSPANAQRLNESIFALESEGLIARDSADLPNL